MRFFDKIRSSFASFMAGRYGADQLGMTMLWTALILSIVGSFSRLGLLTLMADALLLLMFWRMLSKDRLKRQHENQTYLQKTYGAAARDLCQICKQNNLPMEVNLHDRYRLGEANGSGYPNAEFFEIAYDAGTQIILGLDAHEPQEIADPREYERAMAETARFGERRLDRLSFRKA